MKHPDQDLEQKLRKLERLGSVIVVLRSDYCSANLVGPFKIFRSNKETTIAIDKCKCHIHVQWDKIDKITIEDQDVGYGPEGVVKFLNQESIPVLSFYYRQHNARSIKEEEGL